MERFINMALIKEPMNWAILFVVATIWLLAFHVIMTGFMAMSGGNKQAAIAGGPGQIAAPGPGQNFSTSSTIAGGYTNDAMAVSLSPWGFGSGGDGTWTDGYEAKYPTDGWDGNP